MSWFNAVVGSDAPLSEKNKERVGVNGFGVDDVGAIQYPGSVAALLEMGQYLEAISDAGVEHFVSLEQGSTEQVKAATRLGEKTLAALAERIEAEVSSALVDMPGVGTRRFEEYRDWAERSGWAFPVGFFETDAGKCFCLQDDAGLCVFECPVAKLDGLIGDVATALADYLSDEALKIPAHVAIDYSLMMGMDASSLTKHKGFEKLRSASDMQFLTWLEAVDADMHAEISYWENDTEAMASIAGEARDLAFAYFDEEQKLERVLGKGGRASEDPVKAIRLVADTCEQSAIRDLVIKICDALKGERRNQLMDGLTNDIRFERTPGDLCVLDTGLNIQNVEERFNYINEVSMNGDDFPILPLEEDPERVVAVLTRITLAERALLAMAVLIEESQELSEAA
ncbi:MAG: hypothetical protein AAF417_23840 [Pseudomonadota bacterium]